MTASPAADAAAEDPLIRIGPDDGVLADPAGRALADQLTSILVTAGGAPAKNEAPAVTNTSSRWAAGSAGRSAAAAASRETRMRVGLMDWPELGTDGSQPCVKDR